MIVVLVLIVLARYRSRNSKSPMIYKLASYCDRVIPRDRRKPSISVYQAFGAYRIDFEEIFATVGSFF